MFPLVVAQEPRPQAYAQALQTSNVAQKTFALLRKEREHACKQVYAQEQPFQAIALGQLKFSAVLPVVLLPLAKVLISVI